mmetsp:Transcript_87242/g.153912  ORF Transcript_87242/g.153912 Transcript_87242/m.153912 type:complete len:186 (-) Transcript_87242:54-611(-)
MPYVGEAKALSALVLEVSEADCTSLDCTSNFAIKVNSTAALQQLAAPIKSHKNLKRLLLTECEISDEGCNILADILAENASIEELVLDRNKIGDEGAQALALALHHNKTLLTLNLQGQSVRNLREETMEQFIEMFNDNVTLTKIVWHLESRKSSLLNELLTRNAEIRKRKDEREDEPTEAAPDEA